jgi:hypothetical protein
VELGAPNAGRWWSRLRPLRRLGDAPRQATAHQVGRGRRWPPRPRLLGLGLVVVVLGGRGEPPRASWSKPQPIPPIQPTPWLSSPVAVVSASARPWCCCSSTSHRCWSSPMAAMRAGRPPTSCVHPPAVRGVVPPASSGHDPRRGPHGPGPRSATRMAFGRRCDLDLSRAAGAAPAGSLLRRAAPDRCCTPTRAVASHLGACQCRACRTASCAGHRPGLLSIRCNGTGDLTAPY